MKILEAEKATITLDSMWDGTMDDKDPDNGELVKFVKLNSIQVKKVSQTGGASGSYQLAFTGDIKKLTKMFVNFYASGDEVADYENFYKAIKNKI
jgi:hypothetical protein